MKKQEVTYFKKHYIDYLKINNRNSDICVWLENAVDFEGPDGYYFDSSKNFLVIFEHFDIDCSERRKKGEKSIGSTLQRNYTDKYKEVQEEIQTSDDYYESTKIIGQGYYEQDGNNITYHFGRDGDKYRNNFVNNFYDSFKKHSSKIEKYKNNIIRELRTQPSEIQVCFLVEDKTMFGTYYLNAKKSQGEPVVLTDTLQFQTIINHSNVDCVIFGQQHEIVGVGYKGDSELNKIDLNKKEFWIIPASPYITVAKKIEST